MKKIFITLLLIISLLCSTDASAANTVPKDFGSPIETNTYEENDGSTIIEKVYFVPDASNSATFLRSGTKSGWFKKEKTHTWGSGTVMKYYAQGYFTWGNGNATVTKGSGKVNNVPSSVKISHKTTKTGTGKYAGIFNKYAYVTFSFTATNPIGLSTDFSATIRISQSGNNI